MFRHGVYYSAEALKLESLGRQVAVESQIGVYVPEIPRNYLERATSSDCNTLKGLLKELKKLNLKHLTKTERMKRKEECSKDMDMFSRWRFNHSIDYLEEYKDKAAVDIARSLKKNPQFKKKLEFLRIADFVRLNPIKYRALVEARDLRASRVPVRLNALYCINPKSVTFDSQLHQPAPYLKINREGLGPADCKKGLLYANFKECPIIEKRLNNVTKGRWMGRPGSLVKVTDPRLQSMAKHAIKQIKDQETPLEFIRLAGTAWAECISEPERTIYHLMIVASEAGTEKTFYAAVLDDRVISWADTTTPRATMKLPD